MHRNRLVRRNEILDELWPGKFVSEGSLTNLVKCARKVVGDDGKNQNFIKTVHGRGYRFVAITEEFNDI